MGVVAALVAAALYLPSLDYGWVWDDQILVASRAAGGVGAVGFRPVASLLYQLEWAAGYGAPQIFHLTSILLHGLATWLFFLLARNVGAKPGVAFAASLLFAAHPAHVEAVAYVSGRPALLATVFALAALLLARTPELCGPGGYRSWKIWPAFAAMALALLADEAALFTPLVLVGLDRWGAMRVPWRGRKVHYAGFAAVALVYVLVRLTAGGGGAPGGVVPAPGSSGATAPAGAAISDPGGPTGAAAGATVAGATPEASGIERGARGWAAPVAFAECLRILALPHPLNAMRSLTVEGAAAKRAAPFIAIVALLILIAWRWRDPVGRAGALLLVLPLIPSLPIPPFVGAFAEDRSLYYASVGFCLLIGSIYAWLARTPLALPGTAILAVALAGVAAFGTMTRLPVWQSNISLLRAAAAADPHDSTPHLALVRMYAASGDLEAALAELDLAIAIDPKNATAIQARTALLSRTGRWSESIASAKQAIALDPNDALSWANLGDALNQEGKIEEAIGACRRAVAIDSTLVNGWYNLGIALTAKGDIPGAVSAYETALTLQPRNVPALNNLAALYGSTGDLPRARDLYIQVVSLAPNSIEGRMNLALAYLRLGDREKAARERETVRRLNPNAVRQLDEIFGAYAPKPPARR